ncbi:MAG: sulfate transporter CysZ [Beggiatoa sp. IS2]|nr:MAG: sulfate transporter CysZ [Beggiatoa sp. IS2]
MIPNRSLGGSYYFFKGFRLIIQPGVRLFVIIPLLINTLLFSILIYFGWIFFQDLVNYVQHWLPSWLTWLHWLLWPLFIISAFIIVPFAFSWAANLLGSPFNGLLSEAVERHLTGKPTETDLANKSWYLLIGEGIRGELGKLLHYFFWMIILFLISFIPVINIISPILWFVFGAWLLSSEYLEAPLSNHGYLPAIQRRMLAKKLLLTLEFGSVALLITMIPIVNFIAMPVGVAGATALWIDRFAVPHSED